MIDRGLHSYPAKSLFFEAIDIIFGHKYSVTTSCSKIRVQQRDSARVSGPSIPHRDLLGPRTAARSCFRLFKTVFSCNSLPRAVSAVGACQSSQMVSVSLLQPQLHPGCAALWNVERDRAAVTRLLWGPGCCSSAAPGNSLVHRCCRRKGCKPGIWLRNGLLVILHTHTPLSLKEKYHMLGNIKVSVRRNSGKRFLQLTGYRVVFSGFKNAVSNSFPQST